MRSNKSRTSTIQTKILALVNSSLLPATKAQDDFVFLRDNLREINFDSRGVHTPPQSISRIVRHLRAMHHGFRRRAADVYACSAKVLFFDKRDGPSQVRETKRKWVAGLAGADNDGVIFHRGPPLRLCLKTLHRKQMLQQGIVAIF